MMPIRYRRGEETMSRERAKILQMVAEGIITPEEGEKLLRRLDPSNGGATAEEPSREPASRSPLKYLRVLVNDGDDRVNIRVPIALIRTGIKLTTLMPERASEHLTEHGIDLSHISEMDGAELMEVLRELEVDVESEDGATIRVFCE
jgi:hypothetical protein